MIIMKQGIQKKIEVFGLIFIYVLLFVNAVFFKDSIAALISAFFGITYTILAGKGRPYCDVRQPHLHRRICAHQVRRLDRGCRGISEGSHQV